MSDVERARRIWDGELVHPDNPDVQRAVAGELLGQEPDVQHVMSGESDVPLRTDLVHRGDVAPGAPACDPAGAPERCKHELVRGECDFCSPRTSRLPQEVVMQRRFPARFGGACTSCGTWFEPGELIGVLDGEYYGPECCA